MDHFAARYFGSAGRHRVSPGHRSAERDGRRQDLPRRQGVVDGVPLARGNGIDRRPVGAIGLPGGRSDVFARNLRSRRGAALFDRQRAGRKLRPPFLVSRRQRGPLGLSKAIERAAQPIKRWLLPDRQRRRLQPEERRARPRQQARPTKTLPPPPPPRPQIARNLTALASALAFLRRWGVMRGIAIVLSLVLAPVAAVAQVGDPAPAAGDPMVRAREVYQVGVDAYNQQFYGDADKAFREVYDLIHSPEVLFDISLCLEKERKWGPAAATLETYLD